jgi:SAM-dependent methyltransferase
MRRVGAAPAGQDQVESFLEVGRRARNRLDELKPAGWSWEGKRVLDFGCGAGRTLRHFLPDAGQMEIHGCDIDERSIRWLDENLAPLQVFPVGNEPPLPRPDGSFDAIWAVSVFTHIDPNWAEWLLELRRLLSDDGWLLVTFLGDGMLDLWDEVSEGEPWNPDRIGRAVFRPFAPWRVGGPIVFQSEWWIRSHWGRAFTIERLESSGFRGEGQGQGYAVLRKAPGECTPDDLRRPEPGEAREAVAATAEEERRRRELERIVRSRSWRVTEPLRRIRTRAS